MTNNPPILRNSLLALPVAPLVGLTSSVTDAVAALLSGLMVVGNLWVLSVLAPRLIRSIARGESPALWMAALLAKFALLVLLWGALLRNLPALGLVMGFLPMLVGTLVTGLQYAIRPPEGES